jgi:flagellar biosynthesis/type III secretory pathway chaperone
VPAVLVKLDNLGEKMNSLQIVDMGADDQDSAEVQKENYVVNYLKSMLAIEEAIEPFKEQKKELRTEFIENGWLTKDQIWSAVKAYRLYKNGADMDDLNDMFDAIERRFGGKNEL